MYSGFMIDDERIVGLKVGAVLSASLESPRSEPSLHSQTSQDGEMGDIDVFVF